jgi:hypothetical protein
MQLQVAMCTYLHVSQVRLKSSYPRSCLGRKLKQIPYIMARGKNIDTGENIDTGGKNIILNNPIEFFYFS